MIWQFSPAAPGDLPAVFALYEARVRWMDETGIRQWNDTDYLNVYPMTYYQAHQEAGRLFVLRDGREIAAAIVLLEQDARWPEMTGTDAYYAHNLVTALSAKGAGRILLLATEDLARARGKRFMRLDCAVDNDFLNGYYASMGYVPAGECVDGPYVGTRREKRLTE